jgi:type IV pilus assembly protein PilB
MKFSAKSAKSGSSLCYPEHMKGKLPEPTVLSALPQEIMRELRVFVWNKEDDLFHIAAEDPSHPAVVQFVSTRLSGKAEVYRTEKEEVDRVLGHLKRDWHKEIIDLITQPKRSDNFITELVDRILFYALAKKASDIHIEPTRSETILRMRIDGMLHEVLRFPKDIHTALIARMKVLAGLKIDESRHPQDGRIEPENMNDTSFRVSSIPTLHGEKIALRILDESNKTLELKNLGFSEKHVAMLMRNIDKPYGMIVASGPTGSGKTTTLYGLLSQVKKDGLNISTLEDPIEFALPGVNQMQINTRIGLTFAAGLRALLRQDPDIIMVGEIRDSETVMMATNAALTGHLVFSTLHTNDAPSALTRFLEMKVDDFVVASVVNLVVAQRLVRKVCEHCRTEERLSDVVQKKIKERKDIVAVLEKHGIRESELAKRTFAVGVGCAECFETGYRDRIGIYELLETDQGIGELVLKRASGDQIRSHAMEHGFQDMVEDGLEKVLLGQTTLEEVLRTTKNR